jgi:cysteine desulfurase/selenocysteine lyase
VRAGELSAQPLLKHLKLDALLRISLCYYNTANEIDVLIEGIKAFIKEQNI